MRRDTKRGVATISTLKHSRQRESIKEFLRKHQDHPTADEIYNNLRLIYPNISLGTVYRNLALLISLGEIRKICMGSGSDKYDANTTPHGHFICLNCGSFFDVNPHSMDALSKEVESLYDSTVEYFDTRFYGICRNCQKKH